MKNGRLIFPGVIMIVTVKKSSIISPAQHSPERNIWISNLDLIAPPRHNLTIYFYKSDGNPDFFGVEILTKALSKTLVPFYPLAGRLKRSKDGRIEIDCNGEGALFVEAISDSSIDDFGEDFAPKPEFEKLIPKVCCDDISSSPLLLLQVTRFKCGGVCLGVGIHHTIADGASALHFVKSWCEIARGLHLTLLPSLDRSPLKARNPPSPAFQHMEYQPRPSVIKTDDPSLSHIKTSIFKLSRDQLNQLKAKAKAAEEDGSMYNYTTQEILASHLWRCVSEARGLPDDQESTLYIATDGRSRIHPLLPPGYFGNVVYKAMATAVGGDLWAKPLRYIAGKIHDGIVRMDNEYLRSAIDYLEVQDDIPALSPGPNYNCRANMYLTSWYRLPLYDADLGWGKPIYMGPARVSYEAKVPYEAKVYILASPVDDGSLSIAICLQSHHMVLFKKLLYDFQGPRK